MDRDEPLMFVWIELCVASWVEVRGELFGGPVSIGSVFMSI